MALDFLELLEIVFWVLKIFSIMCGSAFSFCFLIGRKVITGSFIGSMKELEEMLEFCKDKKLSSMIEIVKMDYINQAFERLEKNDVRYRFVVDVAGSNL